ncbi:MAG: hypothetical protein SNJ67_06180 [Chloracidobacterium sp.]|uniref:Nucleoside phosphorylase domain-containing protein n=1 Tax=Chloracidobacterium validum TaxID=2821543 RepID=A0ABX8BBJ2_9BACT|nr:hypothetical protein [Chloracidobacterium validum]QUW04301.1 hypothetical protein J8C06_14800 [Chloracidobacterium validum]
MSKQVPPEVPRAVFFVATPGERRAIIGDHLGNAHVVLTGVGPANAARTAHQTLAALAAQGRPSVVVVGIGGALAPSLSVGDVVLGTNTLATEGAPLPGCATGLSRLAARLAATGRPVYQGDHLTVPYVVCQAMEKRRLHQQTGAWVVDMESHAIAQVVQRYALPLLLVRVISDDARQDLPNLNAGFGDNYHLRPLGMTAALLANPLAAGRFLGNLRLAIRELRQVVRVCFAGEF